MSYYLICKNNTCKEFNIRQNVGTFRMAYDAKAHKWYLKLNLNALIVGV